MNPPTKARPDQWAALSALLCLLLPLLGFLPALGGGFLIWDDNVNLLDNPNLWQPLGPALRWMFTDIESVQRYKPLNWIMWRALGGGFGLNPMAFHAANVLLHALNCWLLFPIIRVFLLSRPRPSGPSENAATLSALAGTLCWGLHPLRVEPVAWISGAGYPLATFFALTVLRSFQHQLVGTRVHYQGIALGAFGLSLLSYPAAASLPVLLLALALLARAPGAEPAAPNPRDLALRLLPYGTMAMLLLGATLVTRLETDGQTWNRPDSLAAVGMGTRLMQAPAVWIWYLEKTLIPLQLSPVYADFWRFSPAGFRALVSCALMGLISAGMWRMRRRFPEAPVLWGAFLLLALPVLGITDLPFSPADRYTYVPALALAYLFAALLYRGAEIKPPFGRTATIAAGSVLSLLCPILLAGQLKVWRSPVIFFETAIERVAPDPRAADLHWRLGLHFLTMDEPTNAEREFVETLRLNPHQADAARYLRVLRQRTAPGTRGPTPTGTP